MSDTTPADSVAIRAILDALEMAALLLDADGRLCYANPACAWLGDRSSLDLDALLVPDTSPELTWRRLLDAGQTELNLRGSAGRVRACRVKSSALPGGGWWVLIQDLTAERQQQAERQRLLNFLDSMPLGVMALDSVLNGIVIADARRPGLPIVYANAAFERLTGYAVETTLGRPLDFLYASLEDASIAQALAEHRECRVELRHPRQDGGWFWDEVALYPIFDGQRQLTHYLGLHTDITERKAIQAELERLTTALRQHRDDLLSILDQFPSATLIVDAAGMIGFASASCRTVLDTDPERLCNRLWPDVLPIGPEGIAALSQSIGLAAAQRTPLELDGLGGSRRLACQIKDDPRDLRRRLVFFDDISEIHRLREQLDHSRPGGLIGNSEPMRQLYRLIGEVARGDWTVLIEGETGVGKELVARAIHDASARKKRPFVAVNSAGLSESLLASQLFGHRRGAFTGATRDQAGYFEAAEGGTLFLDEIGDLPLPMQASLLRVLQEREITRLGDTRPRKIDVRIIAATHRQLAQEARAGRFREDLLFRLRVARLAPPPLRERKTDIPLLAENFLRDCSHQAGKNLQGFEPMALQWLLAYDWPGNVRELRACVEYAVVYSQGTRIGCQDLPPELRPTSAAQTAVIPADADERTRILAALRHTGNHCTQAAQLLGISRATFYRRLRGLGVSVERE